MTPDQNFSHFAAVFHVHNIEETLAFYQLLGFNTTFSWQDPVEYAVMKRGENVSFHFAKSDDVGDTSSGFRSIYVFVHEVDALYQEFLDKKIPNLSPPADRDYGMRDFDVVDLNGQTLTFGRGGS